MQHADCKEDKSSGTTVYAFVFVWKCTIILLYSVAIHLAYLMMIAHCHPKLNYGTYFIVVCLLINIPTLNVKHLWL